jgi:hypothetical protein
MGEELVSLQAWPKPYLREGNCYALYLRNNIIMTVDWLKKYVHRDDMPCCDTCLKGRSEIFKKLLIITALLYC